MPIAREDRARYPADWKAISLRVREAAGHRCVVCRVPDRTLIARGRDGTYMLENGDVFDAETGEYRGICRGSEYPFDRHVFVILTVGHVNHTPEDSRDENLRCWCQLHHLRHDRRHHIRRRREKRRAQLLTPDLLETLG